MHCTCARHADLPNTSRLFNDLTVHYDRVADLYPFPTNDLAAIQRAAGFDFPADRRAAAVAMGGCGIGSARSCHAPVAPLDLAERVLHPAQ